MRACSRFANTWKIKWPESPWKSRKCPWICFSATGNFCQTWNLTTTYFNYDNLDNNNNNNQFMALCPGLFGWASSGKNNHPLLSILIINHSLSAFSCLLQSIASACLNYVLDRHLILHHLFSGPHCWLGIRKSIRPVKSLSDGMLACLSVWSEVQMICVWSSWFHCHSIIFCFIKIQNGVPFWCWFIQVVLKKRPLDDVCVSVCVCVSVYRSSLVYLLVWNPLLHIPYISSPNNCLFHNKCPYHCNVFCHSIKFMSPILSLTILLVT